MSLRVYCGTPAWQVSGVNVFAANLVRGLQGMGHEAHLLVPIYEDAIDSPLPIPEDVTLTSVRLRWFESHQTRWRRMAAKLRDGGPAVYLPGYDWLGAWQGIALPAWVRLVWVVHSDEELYYKLTHVLGRYYDAVVAVSDRIGAHVCKEMGYLEERLTVIPYGVPHPPELPRRGGLNGKLRIVYAGRIIQLQKRIFDLPRIAAALQERKVPFELSIAGTGPDEKEVLRQCRPFQVAGMVKHLPAMSNEKVQQLFASSDVFLLPSEFEGLPVALLEAMSQGCVPVVSDIRSGIPQVLEDGVNGFRVPVGDIAGFADHIAELQRDPRRRLHMAECAHRSIATGGFRAEDMAARYAQLFARLRDQGRPRPRRAEDAIPDFPFWKESLVSRLARIPLVARYRSQLLRAARKTRQVLRALRLSR